jgi:hypothetical protein
MFGTNKDQKRYYTLSEEDIQAMTEETVRETVAKMNAEAAAKAKAEAAKAPAPEAEPENDREEAKGIARKSWQQILGLTDPDKVE